MDALTTGFGLVLTWLITTVVLREAIYLVLRVRMRSLERPFRVPGGWPVAWLITLGPAALTVYLAISTLHEEPGAFWIGVIILAIGLALYPLCNRWIKAGRPDAEVELPVG